MTAQRPLPSVTTVSVTAICDGPKVTILDVNGKTLAITTIEAARHVPTEMRLSIERDIMLLWHDKTHGWKAAYSRMKGQYLGWCARKHTTGWAKQAQVWCKSVRWRRNRKRPPKKTPFLNGARLRSANDWECVAFCCYQKYRKMLQKKQRREKDVWLLWCETVYSNGRKREDIRDQREEVVSDAQTISGDTRKTRLQMRFDWLGDNAKKVIA
jgi:hypothetical protein